MWIYLNNSFLSIVEKNQDSDTLHIRARKEGDIEAVFPDADVLATPNGDYKFRTDIPRGAVAEAMAANINHIDYTDFKSSVEDSERHDVYLDLWSVSHGLEKPDDEEEPDLLSELGIHFKGPERKR